MTITPPRPKLLILGYGGHGKDTVAEILRDEYSFQFQSSSMFCANETIYPNWGCAVYNSLEDMYADRRNNRELWARMIEAYNTPDKTKTARTMIKQGADMYVGMRAIEEFEACKRAKIFDHVIWVDRSELLPAEEKTSMSIRPHNIGDFFLLDNNGSLKYLSGQVRKLLHVIGYLHD